jgi:predicted phosphodiesterase
MLKIAHISDSHVNERFHPEHLPRLKAVLEHALDDQQADHIAFTGDITSNADERDLKACRLLFRDLGILSAERLSLVIGNHDIFGGPHLADELLQFPGRCSKRDYARHLKLFHETFSETFAGSEAPGGSPFPYAKVIGNVAVIGLNSVARQSALRNPVGSNGEIAERELDELVMLLKDKEIKHCDHRIVMVHHHLFRRKDESKLHTPPETNRIIERIEQATLKLRGKGKLLKILNAGNVGMVLHGHVHFTAAYSRKGITCMNGAGAIYPVNPREELQYNLITIDKKTITNKVIVVNKEIVDKASEERPTLTLVRAA